MELILGVNGWDMEELGLGLGGVSAQQGWESSMDKRFCCCTLSFE